MKLSNLRSPQRRAVYIQRIRKWIRKYLNRQAVQTTPLMIFGLQRSGTKMLMNVLHMRTDTDVFDENRNNKAFLDFRLRDLSTIDDLIEQSWAEYVCFKPIADSHRISELIAYYPNARMIWLYRSYKDVANSRLRKFPHATRAIRLVCQGEEGGGWFADGVSDAMARELSKLQVAGFTEFDFACLTWWCRNRIFLENRLSLHRNVYLVSYECFATNPKRTFETLFEMMRMRSDSCALRFVRGSSIGRHDAPKLNSQVESLCSKLMADLDRQAIVIS